MRQGFDVTNGEHHVERLTPDVVARLARELPADFSVPATAAATERFRTVARRQVGDIAERVAARVVGGAGLALLVGDGLDELGDAQLAALLYGITLLLGRPMAQDRAGRLVVSVRDERPTDLESARGYTTNESMKLHTDASDVAGTICLSPGAVGGASLFATGSQIHDTLADEAPELLPRYHQMWDWDLRGLQHAGQSPHLRAPIFSCHSGELSCRYGSSLLRDGLARAGHGVPPGDEAALDRFEAVAHRPGVMVRHRLLRGESAWMYNHRILHGRDGFSDEPRAGSVRRLLRTWAWLHEPPRLAADFAAFDTRIFGQDRLAMPPTQEIR